MNALSRFSVDANILQKLQEARETLASHRVEAQKLVRTLDDQIRQIDQLIETSQMVKSVATPLADLFAPTHNTERRAHLSPSEIGEHAKAVIVAAGRPMRRGAILRELEKLGVFVPGGDKAKVLGTTLWRLKKADGSSAFESTNEGYWPAGESRRP
jgi:hypothetical protein